MGGLEGIGSVMLARPLRPSSHDGGPDEPIPVTSSAPTSPETRTPSSSSSTGCSREASTDFQPRTREDWNWEYRDNPAGQQIMLAAPAHGTHHRPLRLPARRGPHPGRSRIAGQGVDSMVHPDYRRGLKKEGPVPGRRPSILRDLGQRPRLQPSGSASPTARRSASASGPALRPGPSSRSARCIATSSRNRTTTPSGGTSPAGAEVVEIDRFDARASTPSGSSWAHRLPLRSSSGTRPI